MIRLVQEVELRVVRIRVKGVALSPLHRQELEVVVFQRQEARLSDEHMRHLSPGLVQIILVLVHLLVVVDKLAQRLPTLELGLGGAKDALDLVMLARDLRTCWFGRSAAQSVAWLTAWALRSAASSTGRRSGADGRPSRLVAYWLLIQRTLPLTRGEPTHRLLVAPLRLEVDARMSFARRHEGRVVDNARTIGADVTSR